MTEQPIESAPPQDAAPLEIDGADASLLALIDRLTTLLDRSDLAELEVQVGATGLVLRKPQALAPQVVMAGGASGATGADGAATGASSTTSAGGPTTDG